MDPQGQTLGAAANSASQAYLGTCPERGLSLRADPPTASTTLIVSVFAILVLIWGTTWLAIKIGLQYLPPFFSLGIRFCVAGSVLLLLMKVRGESIPWQRQFQPFFAVIGLLQFVVSYGVVYWGEQYLSSGLTAVLFALLPLFTGIAAHLSMKTERLGWKRVVGLFVGLGGIVVINFADLEQIHPRAPLAALLMISGPITTAIATVASKKRIHKLSPLTLAAMPMLYGGIMHLVIWAIFEQNRIYDWSWEGLAALAYLTLPGSVITFGGYFWLLARMDVGRANLIAYLTPIVALLVGYFFGGEQLTLFMVLGSAMVLVGVAIASRARSTAT